MIHLTMHTFIICSWGKMHKEICFQSASSGTDTANSARMYILKAKAMMTQMALLHLTRVYNWVQSSPQNDYPVVYCTSLYCTVYVAAVSILWGRCKVETLFALHMCLFHSSPIVVSRLKRTMFWAKQRIKASVRRNVLLVWYAI